MTVALDGAKSLRAVGTPLILLVLAIFLSVPSLEGQSQSGQNQTQAPASPQSNQDIPDAPSTVQPPAPRLPAATPSNPQPNQGTEPLPGARPPAKQPQPFTEPPPPKMPPVETVPEGSVPVQTSKGTPRNQINPTENLYKLHVTTNFVQIPVMVKDSEGRLVEGLLPRDFTVLENGKPQPLTYFTSDPFQLSVAILIDLGMSDVAVQNVNQTYSALIGAFSPYDEVSVYTYSSTVSQATDYTGNSTRLAAVLDSMKVVRGSSSGPPVLGGPLGPQPPMVNGMPVGTNGPPPVYTPAKEAHVLNDAILRAAIDLSKRDPTRRKVILVVSDGRERGSEASYREVLRVLQTHDIQVKAIVLDQGALPVYKQVEKIHHIWGQGYADILPKYTNATGGGNVFTELSRNSVEEAYAQITSEARNQYTIGYSPKAIGGSSAYRSIEVLVDKRGLDIFTKSGYYPVPAVH